MPLKFHVVTKGRMSFFLMTKYFLYIYKGNKWRYRYIYIGFPCGSVVKNPPANAGAAGDTGSIPGSGRPPREGNGNPLQYSCLGNPTHRGTSGATVHGVTRVRYDFATKPLPL